jgi:probable HAF family extracellular repeat protein
MGKHSIILVGGLVLAAATVLPPGGGQSASAAGTTRYKVTDLGTLGGSFASGVGVNNRGEVAGVSVSPGDTALRGFIWRDGRIRDIGTLGGTQAGAGDINESGQFLGSSNTATPAPPSIFNQEPGFCAGPMVAGEPTLACHGFLADHGKLIDVGTLGGANSAAEGLNDAGQVVGVAETTSPDPTSVYGAPTFHAFLWRRGRMTDLGTIAGAPDSAAFAINNRGQVVGASFVDSTKPDAVGFVWQDGGTTLLGNLGGHSTIPFQINDRGQVVGYATLPGDATRHAFLWQRGHMTDLGVLPGDVSSEAVDITNDGEILGESCSTDQCRPVLWRDGKVIDLNQVLSPNSGWQLFEAHAINARGQVTGGGVHNGEFHAYLMTPTR